MENINKRKILDIQDVHFQVGKNVCKTKKVIWVLVADETSRTYKTDAIRCTYIGAGFHSTGAFWIGRKKLVSIPKKKPMAKIEQLIDVSSLEYSAKQNLFNEYIAKKHSGFYMGRVVCDSNGDWAGTIRIPDLGIDYHYYECNSKGDIKRDSWVEFKIDNDSGLLRHCGLCNVQLLSDLKKQDKAV